MWIQLSYLSGHDEKTSVAGSLRFKPPPRPSEGSIVPLVADDQISSVEFLLRSTIGELLRSALGAGWQQFLSRSVTSALERESNHAKAVRAGVPDDPWAAAGLAEIEKVAMHFLRKQSDLSDKDPDDLLSYLHDLWSAAEECRVDISRLRRLRDDQAHPGIAPPIASAIRDEAAATVRRLRLGCESIRRRLARVEDEWWPYIERVDCPGIEVWRYQRSQAEPGRAHLIEGDRLEFVVTAINPVGPDEDLEYALGVQPEGGSFSVPEWGSQPDLHATAGPTGRNVVFRVLVRSPEVAHSAEGWDDEVSFVAKVVPHG